MLKKVLSFLLCICITLISLAAVGIIELNRAWHASPRFFVVMFILLALVLLLKPHKSDPRYVQHIPNSPYLERLREATQNLRDGQEDHLSSVTKQVLNDRHGKEHLRAGKDKGDV